MKRITIPILLLFAILFTSCTYSEGGPESTPSFSGNTAFPLENDFDNRFGLGYSSLVETEDAYYYIGFNSRYLYYFDKASTDYGVLCGKPECMHNENGQNRSCNGYVDNLGRSLNFNNGRLYYTAWDYGSNRIGYYSIALDGSDRRLETYLDQSHSLMCYDLHRGMLYGWRVYDTVADGVPKNAFEIQRCDPNDGSVQVLFTVETTESCSQPCLFFFEDYIYFCYATQTYVDDASTAELSSAEGTLFVGRIDTETAKAELLLKQTKNGGFGDYIRLWVESEDRIFLVPMLSAAGEETINVYLLAGGEFSIVHTFESIGSAYPVDGAVVKIYPAGNNAEIWCFDGKEIYNGEWQTEFDDAQSGKYIATALDAPYGDLNTFYITYSVRKEGDTRPQNPTVCLVRYDLTGGKPRAELLIIAPYA